jgi:hypothetical protein
MGHLRIQHKSRKTQIGHTKQIYLNICFLVAVRRAFAIVVSRQKEGPSQPEAVWGRQLKRQQVPTMLVHPHAPSRSIQISKFILFELA